MRLLPLVVAATAAIPLWAQPKTFANAMGMEFVQVPAGEFQVGCSPGDRECAGDEKPVHTVKISKLFFIGKFEVTQEQWRTLMGGNPSYACSKCSSRSAVASL